MRSRYFQSNCITLYERIAFNRREIRWFFSVRYLLPIYTHGYGNDGGYGDGGSAAVEMWKRVFEEIPKARRYYVCSLSHYYFYSFFLCFISCLFKTCFCVYIYIPDEESVRCHRLPSLHALLLGDLFCTLTYAHVHTSACRRLGDLVV